MKKSLVLALASISFFYAVSLYAAEIKLEGDFRLRGVYADNTSDANDDGNDDLAFNDGRFRLKTTATAGMASAVLVVDVTNAFNNSDQCPSDAGTPVGSGLAADVCGTGNYRLGSVNFGQSWSIFGVREAYVTLDLKMAKLALGRKQFKLGNGLVLDDTVDVVAVKHAHGPLDIVVANAKLEDSNAAGVGGTGGDTDLYILKVRSMFGENHAEAFAAYLKDRGPNLIATATAVNDNSWLYVAGFSVMGKMNRLRLGAEIDIIAGDQESNTGATVSSLAGHNVLLTGGVDLGKADVGVSLLYTSGQERGIQPDVNINGISGNFVLGNILIKDNINSDREGQCASVGGTRIGTGGASCIGGAGVTAVKLSLASAVPDPKTCHTELALIWAQTTEDPTNPLTSAAGSSSDLGIEIDLNHRHKLDDNVAIAVNLGYLLSGDAWKTLKPISASVDGPADNQIKGIITLNYMF